MGVDDSAAPAEIREMAEIIGRVRAADSIATGVVGADLVIETVPERMDLKQTTFAELD